MININYVLSELITMDYAQFAYVIGVGVVYLVAVLVYNAVKKPREYTYGD